MTAACDAAAAAAGYIGTVTAFVDCRAEMLDVSAFGALAAPGSTLTTLLTGFLTLVVAVFGYRLLFGLGLDVRGVTGSMVKIAVVLTLVMSWPAYQTLVHDVAILGPAELVAEVGGAGGLPGSDGSLVQRLDAVDRGLQQLAIFGAGQVTYTQAQALPPPPMAGFDAFALGGARIVFLISSLLCVAGIRVVAGLLLALGPYFITLLLLESTSGFFEGWIRVLAGVSLATTGVSLALGLELTLLEPWLSDALARRAGGEVLPSVATELFVTVTFCAVVMLAAGYCAAKIAAGFRLRRSAVTPADLAMSPAVLGGGRHMRAQERATAQAAELPSRAALTANAVSIMKQRETAGHVVAGGSRTISQSRAPADAGTETRLPGQVPSLGQAFPRRARARTTASGSRRDRSA